MQVIKLKTEELPYDMNEELKLLRTNLLFCGKDKKVVCVTSAFSGEGKSTTTLNLCKSLAELGKSVILIDADMRKSVLKSRVTRMGPDVGLSHFLSGQCEFADVLCRTTEENLSIIFAGKVPPNPSELLSSVSMKYLLTYCRENFDYVIVDCPPIGIVVDAAVVAPLTDGILILIESGAVKYRLAQEVVTKMQATDTPIFGVILNKVDSRAPGRYGRYTKYGRYGRYGKYGKYSRYYNKYYSRYEKYY